MDPSKYSIKYLKNRFQKGEFIIVWIFKSSENVRSECVLGVFVKAFYMKKPFQNREVLYMYQFIYEKGKFKIKERAIEISHISQVASGESLQGKYKYIIEELYLLYNKLPILLTSSIPYLRENAKQCKALRDLYEAKNHIELP